MSSITKSRRRQHRYFVSRDKTACVEFEHPMPNGRHFRLPIYNFSASGVSFYLDDENNLSELDAGTDLAKATVRVGDCMIQGDLVIMHMTPGEGSRLICGALLYPTTDNDLVKLKSVIAGMEAAGLD